MLKIGDIVVHKDHKDITRRVFDIKGNKVLIWGFYQYVNRDKLEKVEG